MFIRIVRPQIKSGQVAEAATRWKAVLGPKAAANPHLKHAYMAATADHSSVVAVTLWDELPDEATTKQLMGEVGAKMQDLTDGPPSYDDYEVLAQI